MAALLALGYSMLVQEQEKKDDALANDESALHPEPTPAATPNPSASTSSLPRGSPPESASARASKSTRPSVTRTSTIKGEGDSESSRKGSSKRQKMHASTKALDEQYAKQMAKVAKLMRKMERAEQREKNARWKAAMEDITQARAAGIDPQKDKVGWDEDSDDEDTLHPTDASLKKPITNLSAKSTDADAPAPESGDTLARFIHAMFASMNPFEEAAHVEKGDDSTTGPATSQSADGSGKAASKDPKDQQASEEVLRLLSSASTMNQASQSRGSVWNVLDRLTPGRSKKAGPNDAEGSLMISAPLFITEDSKVEVAKSSMRTIEEHDSDSEDSKPNSSKFANLVNRMGMDGMFGSKKKSEEEKPAEAEVAEVKAEPEPRSVKEVRVWQPSADGISLQCSWWGYRIYLPPPVLAVLNDQKLEAAKRAALVTTALQWMIDHVPTALLPPQVGLLMSLVRGIIPALGYIGGFVAWSWSAIIGFDQGDGVILSATWLLPIALIPGAWDVEPVRPAAKEIEPAPEPVAEAKTTKPSLSRAASFAKKMPSLERKPSTKSTSSSSKEKKPERKGLERSATEATAIPKRPSEHARRPTAGPLPTPPSSFPRAAGVPRSQSSTPPVTKVKESNDPKPDADRPTLKKSTSKLGLNIVWSDKPVSEEPKEDEDAEKKPSFKLPMPDVTWDHERKAAEAEAAAKLAAEQQAKEAAKAKLKNKYAQALREQMTKDKAPVGWSALSHAIEINSDNLGDNDYIWGSSQTIASALGLVDGITRDVRDVQLPTHHDVSTITQDTWPKGKAQTPRMPSNKENRAKSRETATLKKDTSGLETEIHELEDIGEDKLNSTQKSRLKELRTEVDRIRKIKQDYVKAHPEQSHLVRGLQPRARHLPAGDGAPAGSSAPATRSLFGKNGLPLRPERSIYYDPVLNPYGVPPPGMPYAERPLLPHEIDEDQQGTLEEDSVMNSDESDDDDIVLPAGPPPDKGDPSDDESSDSGSDDDIPMPPGPPPPKAAPPLPTGLPPAPFPPGVPYGTVLPPFPPTIQPMVHMTPHIPPPPPGFPTNMHAGYAPHFAQTTTPYPPQMPFTGPSPKPPRDRQFAEAVRVVQDPLSNVPHVTFQAHQAQRHQPPATAGLPPKPGSVPQAVASATISAEPELRDFKKEATAFVPTSMRRAAKKGTNAGAPSGIKIDAAPNETGDDHGGPSAEPRKDLMSVLGSQLGVPDKPSTASNNKGGQGKDDYEKFLAEVGSFL